MLVGLTSDAECLIGFSWVYYEYACWRPVQETLSPNRVQVAPSRTAQVLALKGVDFPDVAVAWPNC